MLLLKYEVVARQVIGVNHDLKDIDWFEGLNEHVPMLKADPPDFIQIRQPTLPVVNPSSPTFESIGLSLSHYHPYSFYFQP
jgi:hypothetical protein